VVSTIVVLPWQRDGRENPFAIGNKRKKMENREQETGNEKPVI